MGPAEPGPKTVNQGGPGMANEQAAKQADERVGGKRAEFLSRAGQAFDRMFGTDGQNGLVFRSITKKQRRCRW